MRKEIELKEGNWQLVLKTRQEETVISTGDIAKLIDLWRQMRIEKCLWLLRFE